MRDITEQDVIEGWSEWGDGTELVPGFARALAEELNKRHPTLPVRLGHNADLVNSTIGFQVDMLWRLR